MPPGSAPRESGHFVWAETTDSLLNTWDGSVWMLNHCSTSKSNGWQQQHYHMPECTFALICRLWKTITGVSLTEYLLPSPSWPGIMSLWLQNFAAPIFPLRMISEISDCSPLTPSLYMHPRHKPYYPKNIFPMEQDKNSYNNYLLLTTTLE